MSFNEKITSNKPKKKKKITSNKPKYLEVQKKLNDETGCIKRFSENM